MHLDAVDLAGSAAVRVGDTEHPRRALETRIVDVGDNEAARTLLGRMAGYVDAAEAHRAAPGHEQHRALVDDADLKVVRAERIVVVRAEARDNAGYRLGKRALEERVALVRKEAAHLHHDGRKVHVRRLAADGVPGIADGLKLVAGDV